jgi:hypothetical protein
MLYAQSLAQGQYTNTGNWDDIAGLSLTLPAESADEKFALVILNVPNPYAKGNNYPGCNFTIRLNGQIDNNVPIACFTSYNKVADPATAISSGRVPTTLVARIQLATGKKTVIQGAWQSIRGATAVVDTPSTISAVLGRS